MTTHLYTRTKEEIARCLQVAKDLWGVEIDPIVRWDLNGAVAGKAIQDRNGYTIRLHYGFAISEGWDKYRNTVIHEMAHLIHYALRLSRHTTDTSAHGSAWAQVMRALGAPPERLHHYDCAAAKVLRRSTTKQYICACPGKVHHLGPKRAAKHAKYDCFYCRDCKSNIKLKE